MERHGFQVEQRLIEAQHGETHIHRQRAEQVVAGIERMSQGVLAEQVVRVVAAVIDDRTKQIVMSERDYYTRHRR